MPIIDLEVLSGDKSAKKPLLKEEEVKEKIARAKIQIAQDEKTYLELVETFIAGIEKLPTYGSFTNALRSACINTPNDIIDLLLKRSARDFPPEVKQMRAQLFADIIKRMENK